MPPGIFGSREEVMLSAEKVVNEDLQEIIYRTRSDLNQLEGKTVLLTGGAGFLGYYMVQTLLTYCQEAVAPIKLVVYDNFSRGHPQWLKSLADDPNLKVVQHDISKPLPPGHESFDYIIHAASIASPTYYRLHPIETMDANVNGLRHLLDYSRAALKSNSPVRSFLFFSTSEIYGDPDPAHIPTDESYRGNVSCTGPRACYDESKRFGETLCVNFARAYDIPIVIARPFNNYGPGLRLFDRRVIPDFARCIIEDNDIILLSDGSPTRTFCYIVDAVTGYLKILINGRSGESYNIGAEERELSMWELGQRMRIIGEKLFHYRGQVKRMKPEDNEYLIDNPNRRCPVITKARTELGYEPHVSLDAGLERTLVWYMVHKERVTD